MPNCLKFSPIRRSKSHVAQHGSSLVEVMVATLIFSVSMLGMASLQATSIHLGAQSRMYTTATIMVSDLVERMAANRVGVAAGYYSGLPLDQPISLIKNSCLASSCTPKELAQRDLDQWRTKFQSRFPTGASVTINSPVGNEFQLTINLIWQLRVMIDNNSDGVEDNLARNCANQVKRPASEVAYCTTVDLQHL